MPRTKRKVKSIVKTKVISARVTETVHELLHRQAEDAGMTLSQSRKTKRTIRIEVRIFLFPSSGDGF